MGKREYLSCRQIVFRKRNVQIVQNRQKSDKQTENCHKHFHSYSTMMGNNDTFVDSRKGVSVQRNLTGQIQNDSTINHNLRHSLLQELQTFCGEFEIFSLYNRQK